MKNITIIGLILISVVIVSCKKEQETIEIAEHKYDTINAKGYYPVYPGSWWKYQINDTGIAISSVSAGYQLHSFRTGDSEYSDSVYVPFLDSKPIYGYEKVEHIQPPFGDYYTKWPILSETVGFTFDREWTDKLYGDFAEKVEVKSKIFNGTDSLLILEGHWVYGPNTTKKNYREFVKGIGLTKEIILDTVTMDTLYKKILADHFVNH